MPHLFRYLEDFEHPNTATIARAAASLTLAWFENCLANLQTDRAIAWVAGKIGLGQFSVGLASIAKLTHKSLGDNGTQR